MLKRLLLVLSMVIWPSFLMAQNVTVTGTITDSGSTPYANGQMTVTLVNTTGQQATFGGNPNFQKVYSAALDSTGSFSISLPPNSTANPSIQPAGTQWNFAYTSLGNYGAANVSVTITSSGSISGTLSGLTRITWPIQSAGAPCGIGQLVIVVTSTTSGCGTNFTVTPGITGPPATGLLARYDIPSTDTASALTDSSGNANNGTGTVGTAPAVGANGGLTCGAPGLGAAILPSALNSALTIAVYATVQGMQTTAAEEGFVAGNGNGTTSGAVQLIQTNLNQFAGFNSGEVNVVASITGNTGKSIGYHGIMGNTDLIFTMAATDHLYVNGTEIAYSSTGTSAGGQTVGAYQLCGAAAGSGNSNQTYGSHYTIWAAYFYNRVLSALEIAQLHSWFGVFGASRGAAPSSIDAHGSAPNLVFFGDSLTNGHGGAYFPFSTVVVTSPSFVGVVNHGVPSMKASDATFNPQAIVYNCFPGKDNLLFVDLGTNDVAAASSNTAILNSIGTLTNYWKGVCPGGRVILSTMISRTGVDAGEQSLTTAILQNWQAMGAVGVADFMSDANLGATGASGSTSYFNADAIHQNQAGNYDDFAPIAQRAINRASANLNWSTATTYASTAPAATSITAASEATNTVTITSTLNPPVGSCAIITGVTPAGYNSPTTGGCWFVLTTSATNFTYWNPTSGLGAGSVFGVASVPLQKDQDVYFILGGSAAGPNFTLESCEGYSGQSLYAMVTNTNASPWTLTPFKSSETINGGATFTTPVASATNHPVVQLKAIPGAVGTGGCTWQASLQ